MSENYGILLKKIRLEKGDTRDTLANKIGITVSGLRKYEEGERKLKIETMITICNLYDIPLSYFLGHSTQVQDTAYGLEWLPVIKAFELKDITPEEVLNFLQLTEKLRR